MTITRIDRNAIKLLRDEIEAAVQAVAQKHGVSLKAGSGQFSNGPHGSVKIEIAVLGEGGKAITREATDFQALAGLYGFEPEDLGRTFRHPVTSKVYTITGLRPKAGKNPIIATDESGKAYVFPEVVAKWVARA